MIAFALCKIGLHQWTLYRHRTAFGHIDMVECKVCGEMKGA